MAKDKQTMDKYISELEKIKAVQDHHERQLSAMSEDLDKIKAYHEQMVTEQLKETAIAEILEARRKKRQQWMKILLSIPPAVSIVGFVYFVEVMNWIHDDILKIG